MPTLTYQQLLQVIKEYVNENKISVESLSVTRNNIVGLADKIGAVITLDNTFTDKLSIFDAGTMNFGRTVEEWYEDLILPTDYDSEGAGALSPSDPSYRPVAYSYALDKKKFKTTRRYNDVERAVNNEAEFVEIIAKITKRLYDSFTSFIYASKRQALGVLAKMCINEMNETAVYSASGNYSVNTVLKESSGSNTRGIVFKPYKSSLNLLWADAVKQGYIVPLDLVSTMSFPADTPTGEAFIKQVKKDAEIANDESQGHSLNGNSLGATSDLVLVLKQGVMPSIDVDTLAGAFHQDRLAFNAEPIVVPDFGTDENNVFAILTDSRTIRMFNNYRALREQENADGDFINYFLHTENTMHISRNTFVKIYRAS